MSLVVPPVRFGCAGLGGYGAHWCDTLLEEGSSPAASARLVAVCDPQVDRFARAQTLREQGVLLFDNYEQMLDAPIDAVCLPVPIDLHRPFTEAALRAGKAVLCEKPAAGSVADVDVMIASRDRAKLPVMIGFQDLVQPAVREVKQRLLAGEFGRVLTGTVLGCWPRSDRYFSRNQWAGRLKRDGRWVMDSPAMNAMAHYLHLALFLMGSDLASAAEPDEVAAELYRTNPIETFDTCSVCYTFGGGAKLYVLLSHACSKTIDPTVTLETERATIRYRYRSDLQIDHANVRGTERLPLLPQPELQLLQAFRSWLAGESTTAIAATLETSRAHVLSVTAASQGASVIDIPSAFTEAIPWNDGGQVRAVQDLAQALQECTDRHCLLHELQMLPWTAPAAWRHVEGRKDR